MNDYVSLDRIAQAAGVAVSTVSRVLSGRGNLCRITPETQRRVQMVAQQLGYRRAANVRFTKMAKPAMAPVLSATPATREIGLVISRNSPTATLSLIPDLEPVLAGGGLKLVVVTLPTEAGAGRQRIARLIQECVGIICCPSVYTPVSTAIANQRPVFVLWQGAGGAMMKALGLSSNVTPVEADPASTPASEPPPVVTPPPVAEPPPAPVTPPSEPPPALQPSITPEPPPEPVAEVTPVEADPASSPASEPPPVVTPPPMTEPPPLPVTPPSEPPPALQPSVTPEPPPEPVAEVTPVEAEPVSAPVFVPPPVVTPPPMAEPPTAPVTEPPSVLQPSVTPEPSLEPVAEVTPVDAEPVSAPAVVPPPVVTPPPIAEPPPAPVVPPAEPPPVLQPIVTPEPAPEPVAEVTPVEAEPVSAPAVVPPPEQSPLG
ncbi:MAG: LacI family DNA-binding transcriptional regulator [bacterium]